MESRLGMNRGNYSNLLNNPDQKILPPVLLTIKRLFDKTGHPVTIEELLTTEIESLKKGINEDLNNESIEHDLTEKSHDSDENTNSEDNTPVKDSNDSSNELAENIASLPMSENMKELMEQKMLFFFKEFLDQMDNPLLKQK